MRFIRSKMFWSLLVLVVIVAAGAGWYWRAWGLDHRQSLTRFGVSYDPYYATDLGLDPFSTFDEILRDLEVKRVRLSARWDIAEPQPGEYDWTQADLFVAKASQANAGIILAIGAKLPRWPECYRPQWATKLNDEEYRAAVLQFVQASVKHFQANGTIIAWQVENEPLVGWFGDCPKPDAKLVAEEIALVKKLDPRPVLVTDSGEMSTWYPAAKLGGDWFGTTMYRVVKDPRFGYWEWPLPPHFYYLKTQWLKKIFGVKLERVIVSELQAEPWVTDGFTNTPLEEQYKSMSLDQFKDNVEYARRAGFDEVYLWGAEWWYWMKAKQGVPDYWDYAKTLFAKPAKNRE